MKTAVDQRSEAAQRYRRWYKSRRWKDLRAQQLKKSPYCESPYHRGKYVTAIIADHVKPHKGDSRLFFNPQNLTSLCAGCHSSAKQSEEAGGMGFNKGHDDRGWPMNQDAAWHEKTSALSNSRGE